jgi:hypothetical protein
MYYVAYYPDGSDVVADCPDDRTLARCIQDAWGDNIEGFDRVGPDPIKVEVYSDTHQLLASEEK